MHEASANIRVALFRAEGEARVSAARLAARGLDAVLAPVIAPIALEPASPAGTFDAVVATSAKALDLAQPGLLAPLAQTPLYVVGEAGVAAAARQGRSVTASAADAAALARLLATALPARGRLLYLAGAERKPQLEAALIRAGLRIVVVEVYAARARAAWSVEEARDVASCRAALHYSRRSAELALDLAARAGIWSQWQAMKHVAISRDAAEPLGASALNVVVAAEPREESMFAELDDRSP